MKSIELPTKKVYKIFFLHANRTHLIQLTNKMKISDLSFCFQRQAVNPGPDHGRQVIFHGATC